MRPGDHPQASDHAPGVSVCRVGKGGSTSSSCAAATTHCQVPSYQLKSCVADKPRLCTLHYSFDATITFYTAMTFFKRVCPFSFEELQAFITPQEVLTILIENALKMFPFIISWCWQHLPPPPIPAVPHV